MGLFAACLTGKGTFSLVYETHLRLGWAWTILIQELHRGSSGLVRNGESPTYTSEPVGVYQAAASSVFNVQTWKPAVEFSGALKAT